MLENDITEVERHGTITVTEDWVTVPKMNNPPVMLEFETGEKAEIHHKYSKAKGGFDLTDFDSAETFAEMLETVGLDYYWNYYAVNVKTEIYESTLFFWANEEGMILCGNNPITGEYRQPEERSNETGYASYMGIEGTEQFRNEAMDAIREYAVHVKGEKQNRAFI